MTNMKQRVKVLTFFSVDICEVGEVHVVHEALAVCMSILFSVQICEAREVRVVHEALAVADGVEDAQGGGLGDVLLVEI